MKKSITAGIDFGNQKCVLSIPTEKGIEIISNESSSRKIPSIVGFYNGRRASGEFAQQQQMINVMNTITQLKRLIGLEYGSEEQKKITNEVTFKIKGLPDKTCYIELDNGEQLKIEQILGYFIKNLFEIIHKKNANIEQIVLTVPSYWTEVQRRSILNASSIADVKVAYLLTASLASAISYVKIHGERLPDKENKGLYVLFIELGDTSMNVSVAKLSKKSIEMKSDISDETMGGHYLNEILENYMIQKVQLKYKIDPKTNPKSFVRFKEACEKLKKSLSSNPVVMFEIQSLMNDIDVSIQVKREEFEKLIQNYIGKIKGNIDKSLQKAKVKLQNISYVEMVGGTSRIPLIKEKIKSIIGNEVKMSLDLDECFAIGAGYMASKIDGNDIGIKQISNKCPYSIDIKADKVDQHVNIFNDSFQVPVISKALIPITKEQKLILLCDKGDIGSAVIVTGVDQQVHTEISIMINKFGIISIKNATFQSADGKKYKCKSFIYTPMHCLSSQEVLNYKKIEEKNSSQDKKEIEIDEAKNELESLIFSSENILKSIKKSQKNEKIIQQLNDKVDSIHQWFVEHELDRLNVKDYQSKIQELKEIMNPKTKNNMNASHKKEGMKVVKKSQKI